MEEDITKQDLSKIALKGSAYNLVTFFILKFGGLLFTLILARMLLPELFGIYSLVFSITTMALVFTDFGINTTFLRYLSDSIGKKDNDESHSFLTYFLKFKTIFIFLIVGLLLVSSKFFAYNIYQKPLIFYPLLFACLFVMAESFRNFFGQILYAKKDFKSPVLLQIILQILKIGISIITILLIANSKVSAVFIALFASSFITLIILIFIIVKNDSIIIKAKNKIIDKSKVNSYWKFMIITSASLTFFGSIDMLMLGKFVAAEYLGYYRANISLVLTLASLFSLSGGIFLPIFTQIKGERFKRGFQKLARYVFILTIPATIGAFFVSKYLILLIYGKAYLTGVNAIYFLIPILISAPLISLYSVIFQSKEKPNLVSKAISISLLINIGLNSLAIFLFKGNAMWIISGVGLATMLSRLSYLGLLMFWAKKNFDFTIRGFGTKTIIFSTAIMAIFLWIFNKSISLSIIHGTFEILLGFGIYLTLMLLMKGISAEDLSLISKLIRR